MRIIGEQIDLRPMTKEDISFKVKWYNDPDVSKTLLIEEKLEIQKSLAWFEKAKNDETRRDFVIESKDGRPIGLTGLLHISKVHQTAECFGIIGEKEFWGKGIGTELHILLLDWAFRNLGLNKIWADIRAENTAIIRIIEKLGFKIEGTLRQEKVIDGKRIDVVRIGLLRDEFYKTNPGLNH